MHGLGRLQHGDDAVQSGQQRRRSSAVLAPPAQGRNPFQGVHTEMPRRYAGKLEETDLVDTMVVRAQRSAPRPAPELTLVAFSSQALVSEVREALLALGYGVRMLDREHRSRLRAMTRSEVVVLLVGDSPAHQKNAHALVYQLPEAPVFVLFESRMPPGQEYLVQQCRDFSIWPCADSELQQRLDRLDVGRQALVPLGRTGPGAERSTTVNMVGESAAFRTCCEQVRKFSRCTAPVLIEGETGTGKDLMARAIHDESERRDRPFVPVNCGTLPDGLFENELFGHEQGAYTGAGKRYRGLIGQAQGGTLFLDEVDALSVRGQVALLRFLEDGRYRPLGGSASRVSDVRVLTASNSNLQMRVKQGAFRSDLFFRLNVLAIALPALRERPDDIELLAEHFMQGYRIRYRCAQRYLDPASLDWMRAYVWPGNIRQLKSVIHRAFLLADGAAVRIPRPTGLAHASTASGRPALPLTLESGFNEAKARWIDEFEKQYLTCLMRETRGNVTRAALRAGKERRALGKLLSKHGIQRGDYTE